ncbi:GD14901 [Drosophila simulans]|uniref:GD14901 n=1 Tax=Drosophila simulans TaxID=7240 RepID=B4QJ49_DROSI|nr:GD14901 [Drosophila simulans]
MYNLAIAHRPSPSLELKLDLGFTPCAGDVDGDGAGDGAGGQATPLCPHWCEFHLVAPMMHGRLHFHHHQSGDSLGDPHHSHRSGSDM